MSKANQAAIIDFVFLRAEIIRANGQVAKLKKTLNIHQSRINSYFTQNGFFRELLACRSKLIDEFLINLWEFHFPHQNKICLIAVGGYGREELLPYSDIDILVLTDKKEDELFYKNFSAFFTTLWDIGLNPSHSTRSIEETLKFAKDNLSVYSNLLEARLLAGDKSVLLQLQKKISCNPCYTNKQFYEEKIKEQNNRHKRFNETAHILEPDIKNSPGALRDIHLLKWLCIHFFHTKDLNCLVDNNILMQSDLMVLLSCEDFLLKIRYALHLTNHKDDNRLFFDKQLELSKYFGYKDSVFQLGIETFMKDYYLYIKEVRSLSEIILQYFYETLFNEWTIKKINSKHFQLKENFIDLKEKYIPLEQPSLLMEAFTLLSCTTSAIGFTFTTLYQLRKSSYLINDSFRKSSKNQLLFIQIFQKGKQIHLALQLMNRHGFLGKYLPEFQYIIGLTQHDLFHVYTVDQHIIFVIKQIDILIQNNSFYKDIFVQLPKPEILYLAAFFHDIGKGHRTDHSKYGAKAVIEFSNMHHFSNPDKNMIAWLVQDHLLMSATAQKKDLSNHEIVKKFAARVKNIIRLNYLFLLTVADIQATNPKLWNSWRDSLLKQLYIITYSLLARKKQSLSREQYVKQQKQRLLQKLLSEDLEEDKIMALWEKFGFEYFLKETIERIAWHTKVLYDFDFSSSKNIISIQNHLNHGATEIFICSKDRDNLFSNVVMALDKLNLNIVDAKIITSNNAFSLDTFAVLSTQNKTINSAYELKKTQSTLENYLKPTSKELKLKKRRISRQMAHFCHKSKINFQNKKEETWTRLSIKTLDRPGLLAQIGLAFKKQKIRVHFAKIVTLGDQIEDIFCITDQQNNPLKSIKQQIMLRKQIKEEII